MLRAVTVSIDEATIDIRPHTRPGYLWVIIRANDGRHFECSMSRAEVEDFTAKLSKMRRRSRTDALPSTMPPRRAQARPWRPGKGFQVVFMHCRHVGRNVSYFSPSGKFDLEISYLQF